MSNPTAQLLAATRRRLFLLTLALVATLVVAIGAATAVVGLRALDSDVDRALAATVDAAVVRLDGEMPSGSESGGSEDTAPAAADTVLLYLDSAGKEIALPTRVALGGLPDESAVAAAKSAGRDLRTVSAGGVEVRLLTEAVVGSAGQAPVGYVQGGFVLTLHDQQSNSLAVAIALVGAVGLLGAAVVTLLVTGDAVAPIRRSFARQQRFVADASHELKTPPAIIRANAEVLEREQLVKPNGQALVADIVSETDRLARLVGDLLQLASSDAAGLVVELRPTDLGAIAQDTVRRMRPLATARGVDLRLVAHPGASSPTLILGDYDRVTQLLVILVDNAIGHTPSGSAVTVTVRAVEHKLELGVADHGPGVPATDRERVFEPFTRLPGLRRDQTAGTGLGLAIARRIVDAHHGTIRVEDADGGGARFVASFPASGG